MKTLIPMLSLAGVLVFGGCASEGPRTTKSTQHQIKVHQSKTHGGYDLYHDWSLKGLDQMDTGTNTVVWHRVDKDSSSNAKPFRIVVAISSDFNWDDGQSVNKFKPHNEYPFTDAAKYQAIDSWPLNNEQVVSLQVTQVGTNTNAQYYVLVRADEGYSMDATVVTFMVPFTYYMIDSVLSW